MTRPSKSQLERGLSLALCLLAPHEPPDSRAVSNEFVALAALHIGDASDGVMKIIDDALRSSRRARITRVLTPRKRRAARREKPSLDPLRNNPIVGFMSNEQAERILAEMRTENS